MSKQTQRLYEFGEYSLDTRERLLRRDGVPVALTPKAFETLVLLIEGRGRLIAKQELIEQLWPDSHVEESNLSTNIWTLRKTLGEAPNGRGYIETVSKRGYRFIAGVTELPNGDDTPLVLERHTFKRIVTDEREEHETTQADAWPPPVVAGPTAVEPERALASSGRLHRSKLTKTFVAAAGLLVLLVLPTTLYRRSASRTAKRDVPAVVAGRPALRSLAVLPFKTIGAPSGADGEYLGIGMSDALITRLGNTRQVIVRPTSAVRRYTDPTLDPLAAGREQGVEAVLDGSVQRAGDRIRVTVQLFRAQDGAPLWSAKFDERFTDIFAVQDSISQQVMRELLIELNPDEQKHLQRRGSDNVEAYHAYLKGLYFWNKRTHDGYQKSVDYFKRAIELDPNFAEAYVGLGNSSSFLGGHDRASEAETFSKARAAAKKALELDETLAEAHAALGLVAMNFDWNWPEAEREFRRAIELNPNYATAHQWYGEFLACMGRFDEGLAEMKQAQTLDPLSLTINTDLAKVYMFARRYDEAIEQYKRALEMDPEFDVAHGLLAMTYSAKGMHGEAVAELGKIKHLEKDPLYLSYLVHVNASGGRNNEARQALDRMSKMSRRTYVSPVSQALAYAALSDNDQAFKWLDRVFDEHASGGAISLKVGYVWDNLRSDPRYPPLLQRAGF